jgi:RimJ/RimL family protein N-acetyltransferase
VRLRPYSAGFTDEELAELYRWSTDPFVAELSGGAPLEMSFGRFRDMFLQQLSSRNSDSEQLFAILDENDELIGRTGLFALDPSHRRAELGIVIGEPDNWGRGYGRDALQVLVDFGFRTLGLRTIVLYTYTENERARRAYESVGFQAVRELRRFSLSHGARTEIEMVIKNGEQ